MHEIAIPFAAPMDEAAVLDLIRGGVVANASEFRGFAPGELLLVKIARRDDGTVIGYCRPRTTDIPQRDFAAMFPK